MGIESLALKTQLGGHPLGLMSTLPMYSAKNALT